MEIMEIMERKLYLGEIVEVDNVEYTRNNLILSPVGSGKTHFIMNTLNNKYEGKKLMLLSTTSLKESVNELDGTITSQELRRRGLGVKDEDIHIMTYSEFGSKVKWTDEFVKDYSVIFCDEIHSLMDYYFKHNSVEYAMAIRTLFKEYEDKIIFHFTATTEKMDAFASKENQDIYKNLNIINYENDERIVRYHNLIRREITSTYEIEDELLKIEDLRSLGKVGIIFNDRIDGMERIENILLNKGFRSISIWSINNKKHEMTEEQLRVRGILLKEGIIPEGYDFIIINGAMREGWNLKDDRVEVAIMNTLDETNRIQARGRIRKDIAVLIERVKGDYKPLDIRIIEKEKNLGIIERNLGKFLDKDDKDKIAEEFNIRREDNGRLIGWRTIKNALEKNGYIIKDSQKTIDGSRKRVSVITKEEQSKPSTESSAKKYLVKLEQLRFADVNEAFLNKYIGKGKAVAFKHIKSSYIKKVGEDNWTERKFTDVTYQLVKDNELFTSSNYSEYGVSYNQLDPSELLKERAKYESSAKRELEKAETTAEQDLLDYISAHGGR